MAFVRILGLISGTGLCSGCEKKNSMMLILCSLKVKLLRKHTMFGNTLQLQT